MNGGQQGGQRGGRRGLRLVAVAGMAMSAGTAAAQELNLPTGAESGQPVLLDPTAGQPVAPTQSGAGTYTIPAFAEGVELRELVDYVVNTLRINVIVDPTLAGTVVINRPITVEPMRTFPVVKDLVTDVSWNYEVKKSITRFQPSAPNGDDGTWRMEQYDIERPQEFRKCIECFLCQDVCHVLRDHGKHAEFIGPRFLIQTAAFEMHPLDTEDRLADLQDPHGIGYCNITKCCTKVCPEHITITDNGIIPLKERVVNRFYDPVTRLLRVFRS